MRSPEVPSEVKAGDDAGVVGELKENGTRTVSQAAEHNKAALSPLELRQRWIRLEVQWWTQRLTQSDMLTIDEPSAAAYLKILGEAPSWEQVDVLRALGRGAEARKLAAQLPLSEADYALSMLDLAQEQMPPWPLLIQRLRSCATGEETPFFAHVGLIFVEAESGDLKSARADYEQLGNLVQGAPSPLFGVVGQYLARKEALAAEVEAAREPEDMQAASNVAVQDQTPPTLPVEGATPEEPPPKKKDVSTAIQAKVDEADTLWRGGDRDRAVVLYRQVLAELGTRHFLGQRASARIAQAAREKNDTLGGTP